MFALDNELIPSPQGHYAFYTLHNLDMGITLQFHHLTLVYQRFNLHRCCYTLNSLLDGIPGEANMSRGRTTAQPFLL